MAKPSCVMSQVKQLGEIVFGEVALGGHPVDAFGQSSQGTLDFLSHLVTTIAARRMRRRLSTRHRPTPNDWGGYPAGDGWVRLAGGELAQTFRSEMANLRGGGRGPV
ncbi:MAG TPA: hypothetical protein VFJ19_16395 [Nocardioidaceae bacterium]|nr:hypothetical protein [Nocardioidaceae bacterium]